MQHLRIVEAAKAQGEDAKPEDEMEIVATPISPSNFHDYPAWDQPTEEERNFRSQTLPNVVVKEKVRVDGERRTIRVDLSKVEGYQGAMKQLQLAFPARNGKATLYKVRFLEK